VRPLDHGITVVTIRIVLVDDHALFRQSLRALIERHSEFEIAGEATSGREAVAIARDQVPDVVVMDIAMKDMNGIEATRQLRAELPQVRVLVLSSHADPGYVKDALDAGAAGYVLKANAFDELKRALEAIHRGKSYLCADVTSSVIEASMTGPNGLQAEERSLSAREREVLQLLAEGLTSSQIGKRLFVATSTIETHRRNLARKLGTHSVADLTKYAIRERLTSIDL